VVLYQVYICAAAAALVVGIGCLRRNPKSLALLLGFISAILLFFLLATRDLNPLISAATTFCFILFAGAVYVASNLIQEIADTTNLETGSAVGRRIAILWLPLVAIFAAASAGTYAFHDFVANHFYSVESSKWSCTKPSPNFVLCKDPEGSFKGSLHRTNFQFFLDAHEAARNRIERLRTLPQSLKPAFKVSVDEALFGKEPIIPGELFPRLSGCTFPEWFYKLGYCIKAEVLNPIYDAYEKFHSKLRNDIDGHIEAEFNQADTNANNLANAVYLNLDRQLQRTQENIDTNVDRGFFLRDALSLFSFVTAVLLLFKILLYIIVRIVFDEKTALQACPLSENRGGHRLIEASPILAREDNSNSYGRVIGIPPSDQAWFITMSARGAQPGYSGQFSWPHKFELILKRLLKHRTFFYKYPAGNSGSIPIHTDLSNAFCAIALKEGECLAFAMPSLFAFTDNITFRLAIRIRAAILLQRRFLFATALGPGTIVLVARGGSLTLLPNPQDAYSSIDHVIGFDMNGSVYTNAHHGFAETYFLSFSVRPTVDTLMIREAPVHPQWSLRAALRRLGALVLPF
jgi:hypothetical protein